MKCPCVQPATVLCVAEYRVGQLIFHKGKTYDVKRRVGDVFEIYNDAAGSFASLHVDSLALIFQVVSYSTAVHTDVGKLLEALRLCVASLDQLLPYLAKVPTDIGLLNGALIAGRAALANQGGVE
ncbi:hypothetical protein [Stutzerimonas nitrititolerans]|uniref:hypothetical protein n=1 Tax=Stutzerimonas nitrititolerans TaxID=2482751 RepID=UPI0028A6BEBE|nr:hypothetical protein [Stutzerimonas nitrititolerans]